MYRLIESEDMTFYNFMLFLMFLSQVVCINLYNKVNENIYTNQWHNKNYVCIIEFY